MEITEAPRAGWGVANDGGLTVALDLRITPELRRAGLARDVVRLIQQARKDSGLDITDRISLRWQATGETADAIAEHQTLISDEVLAVKVDTGPGTAAEKAFAHHEDQLDIEFWIAKAG